MCGAFVYIRVYVHSDVYCCDCLVRGFTQAGLAVDIVWKDPLPDLIYHCLGFLAGMIKYA